MTHILDNVRYVITTGQRSVLALMDRTGEELVLDRPGGWWVGASQIDGRIAWGLLRNCLVSGEMESGRLSYFHINSEGRSCLKDVSYTPEIWSLS